ncbi:DNA repair protein RadA [Candidatus Micrarchaeota archaeon]|jgi:hypothetical protein|nr:DNA repair protein RadA [Candidatus Micrarchaeota archaeon]
MTEKKSDESKEARVYTCKYCGEEYKTQKGLRLHLPKCEYRPDVETDDASNIDDGGVALFDDDDVDAGSGAATADGGDVYQCPGCGFTATRAFARCPECGSDLEW